MGKFEIFRDNTNLFRFILKVENGEIILSSGAYPSKSSCESGIQSVRMTSGIDARYERLVSKERHPYFNLKSFNGQITGTSKMYNAVSAMERGILAVKNNAFDAKLLDLTLKVDSAR